MFDENTNTSHILTKLFILLSAQSFDGLLAALLNLLGYLVLGIFLYIPPLRYLLRKFVLPKPGEGPSDESMAEGFLHLTGYAKGSNGTEIGSTMSFNVDPGYKDTARMLVESALSLSNAATSAPFATLYRISWNLKM